MKNRFYFKVLSIAAMFLTLLLSGCDKTKIPNFANVLQRPSNPDMLAYPKSAISSDTDFREKSLDEYYSFKVALLVPQSGRARPFGEELINAAQMAMFQMGLKELKLKTYDTQGTVQGAENAIKQAKLDGAHLILGPLGSDKVTAIKPIAQAHPRVNVVSLTTDRYAVGKGVFAFGVMPEQVIERTVRYAYSRGKRNFAVLYPRNQYGRLVLQEVTRVLKSLGEDAPVSEYYATMDYKDINEAVRRLKANMNPGTDAIVIPDGIEGVRTILPSLQQNDVNLLQVQLLGSGLWNNPGISNETLARGAWFAAPTLQGQRVFDEKFRSKYGKFPHDLARIIYDAVSLAGNIATKTHGEKSYGKIFSLLTQSNGYYGADGLFRLNPSGLVDRGLSILEITKEGMITIDHAPTTFDEKY